MKTLVLTDVHANFPALLAVIKDASEFDQLLFMGDLVNFGPHPSECVEFLKALNPVCVMGNHDAQIASKDPKNFWDKWARRQLAPDQLEWLSGFRPSVLFDNHILVVHGVYSVDYDILPNSLDEDIENAFKAMLTPEVDEVWFGHYHYDIVREINGVTYRGIRPVGHHRDKDTRASYYIYENNALTHHKIRYDLEKTVLDIEASNIFPDALSCQRYVEFLRNAYHEDILRKDIEAMKENEEKRIRNQY